MIKSKKKIFVQILRIDKKSRRVCNVLSKFTKLKRNQSSRSSVNYCLNNENNKTKDLDGSENLTLFSHVLA